MTSTRLQRVMYLVLTAALLYTAGCRSAWRGMQQVIPDIPADLQVQGPQLGEVHAVGFQVYSCTQDEAGKLSWTLKGPEATFVYAAGQKGKHYAGPAGATEPTWEAADGSKVVGKKIKEHASPASGAVPWLLLQAARNEGTGMMSNVTFVQRIHTSGGKAPAVGDAKAGDTVRVPYSADYVFYGPNSSYLPPR